jgi:hypothetical protein
MGVDAVAYGTPRLDLAQALIEYQLAQSEYIATKVFPLTPVMAEAGQYSAIMRESLTEHNDVKVKNGNYNEIGLKVDDVTFACQEYGAKALVLDKQRRKYKNDFDLERMQALKAMYTLLIAQEIRVAALLFNATTFTGASLYLDTSAVWATSTTDVIADINTAKNYVRQNSGMEANALVLNAKNLSYLLNNDDIVGRVQYATVAGQQAVLGALANILGLEKVIVGKAVYNSKPEGGTAFSGSQVWSDSYASVCHVPANPELDLPAVGRSFLWADDSQENVMVETYRDDDRRGDWVRVRQNTDEKLIDSAFGFLLKID